MGYSKQRMANTFASWTKVKKREDSIGQIIYQPFGNAIDAEIKNLVILKESLKLKSKNLEVLDFYAVYLEESEHITYNPDTDLFEYPGVYDNDAGLNLTRYDRWESFFYKVPDTFLLEETNTHIGKVWETGDQVPVSFARGEHLGILVQNSSRYYSNLTERNLELPFGGYYCIIITGLNEEFEAIQEYVRVFDDGYYETENVFRSITEIESDGFDGNIKIFFGRRTLQSSYNKRYKFEIATTRQEQGPMELEIVAGDPGESYFQWKLLRETFGVNYRNAFETNIEDLKGYILFEEKALDKDGNPYELEDYFINPINSRIYALDTQNRIHIHEFYLTDFKVSQFAASDFSPIKLEIERQRVSVGDQYLTEAIVLNKEVRVLKFCLKVVHPSGTIYYLDKGGNRQLTELWIDGIDHPFPENTWKDFRFYYSYEEVGQYDWNIEIESPQETFSYNYSVVCESSVAIESYTINQQNLNSIYLSKENYICVENSTDSYLYKEEVEGFFGDFANQRLIFRKEYNDIDVVV